MLSVCRFSTDSSSRTSLAWTSVSKPMSQNEPVPFASWLSQIFCFNNRKLNPSLAMILNLFLFKLNCLSLIIAPWAFSCNHPPLSRLFLMAGIGFLFDRAHTVGLSDPSNVLSWTYVVPHTYLQNWIINTRLGYDIRGHRERSEKIKS